MNFFNTVFFNYLPNFKVKNLNESKIKVSGLAWPI